MSRQVRLKQRPTGVPDASTWEVTQEKVAHLQDGQVCACVCLGGWVQPVGVLVVLWCAYVRRRPLHAALSLQDTRILTRAHAHTRTHAYARTPARTDAHTRSTCDEHAHDATAKLGRDTHGWESATPPHEGIAHPNARKSAVKLHTC